MFSYILKQLASAIPTLALLMTLTFFLLRLAPGGPFDSDRVWPPEIKANIDRQYELDKPVSIQFLHWTAGALKGDFRESFQYTGTPVSKLILDSLPVSMSLGFWALLFSVVFGLALGAAAAWKHGTLWDSSREPQCWKP
jgi:oligopeptide transport system permease protein